jgi:hypothetical protein
MKMTIQYQLLAGLRICITFLTIRIQLFTLMRIRIQLYPGTLLWIRILLLIKVMGICDIDPPGLHFEPPGLHCERPRPFTILFYAYKNVVF